jgi:hypothetical protein
MHYNIILPCTPVSEKWSLSNTGENIQLNTTFVSVLKLHCVQNKCYDTFLGITSLVTKIFIYVFLTQRVAANQNMISFFLLMLSGSLI